MIDEVNKFIVRNSINKISTPTLNCAMPQTKIRGQTPVLIRCSGRSFCFALSPSTLDLRLQPVLFFVFNSFLFGVVSFPFQNIQVQQRKKKYCSMPVVFNSTEKTKSKVDRDSKSTVSWEKRGILKNVKKLGWRICRMNKLTSFWFIRKSTRFIWNYLPIIHNRFDSIQTNKECGR